MWALTPERTAAELAALIEEKYDLVEQHLPNVDTGQLRKWFRFERTTWDEEPECLSGKTPGE